MTTLILGGVLIATIGLLIWLLVKARSRIGKLEAENAQLQHSVEVKDKQLRVAADRRPAGERLRDGSF